MSRLTEHWSHGPTPWQLNLIMSAFSPSDDAYNYRIGVLSSLREQDTVWTFARM
jgi:hypothetical protein